jgi:hypothetical protein
MEMAKTKDLVRLRGRQLAPLDQVVYQHTQPPTDQATNSQPQTQ